MATLIAAYNSSGCIGRCDAKCYNATHPDCNCICGGMNHGAGAQRAIENTNAMWEDWISEYEKSHDVERFKVPARDLQTNSPQQLALFGGEA
jgi:hypothetical protein